MNNILAFLPLWIKVDKLIKKLKKWKNCQMQTIIYAFFSELTNNLKIIFIKMNVLTIILKLTRLK